MIYTNNTHKQEQPTTVVENKNAQNVQDKEKETTMCLKTIKMKENEQIELTLPCGSYIEIRTNDEEQSFIQIYHPRTAVVDEIKLESFGYGYTENNSWTEASSVFKRRGTLKGFCHVSHTAFNK